VENKIDDNIETFSEIVKKINSQNSDKIGNEME
jgi:hypothetical protein